MRSAVACFLGAGFSYVAGVPLARDLLRPSWLIVTSEASRRRFEIVHNHYERWQQQHPDEFPEQYLGQIYQNRGGLTQPKWEWVVEYVSTVIASAGTPPPSLNRNPRYSNRINRPFRCLAHQEFWETLVNAAEDLSVLTTNYDILIERVLRHRSMQRPRSPGCYYGGLARPQRLTGAAQPFSRWSPERVIEMTGIVPVFKLHGSLNWSLSGGAIVAYQDMRPVYRHGGTGAIVPPVPEKLTPAWLEAVWRDAASSLRRADVWVICGYSFPPYDTEVAELLSRSGVGRSLIVFLLSPPPKFPDPQDMKRGLAPTRWHEPWSHSRIRRFVSF
jgi:hypothetical protein